MRRLIAITLVVAFSGFAEQVSAADPEEATISAGVEDEQGAPPATPAPGPPSCYWDSFDANATVADAFNIVTKVLVTIVSILGGTRTEITITYYSERNVLHRYDATSGAFEYRADYRCPEGAVPEEGRVVGATRWFPAVDPDPVMLLRRSMIDVEVIAPPVPSITPPPSKGVPVNLGMWLAVAPAGPYEAWAGFNDRVWARRVATLESTTFDPGNGDPPITCPGAGTPIPAGAVDEVEQGGCGYTYTTLDDVRADLTFTVTSRWAVRWELSDGRSGADPDIVLSTSFPYDVYELQTIGEQG